MWNKLLASFLGVTKQLAAALAPLFAKALSELLTKATEKATAYITHAAADPTLLSGEARHSWVVSEIKPLLKDTATSYIEPVREAVISLAVKAAYDQLNK